MHVPFDGHVLTKTKHLNSRRSAQAQTTHLPRLSKSLYYNGIPPLWSQNSLPHLIGRQERLALQLAQQAVVHSVLHGSDVPSMGLVVGALIAVKLLSHALVVYMERK